MRRQELELDKLPCREEVLQHNTGMHHHQQKRLVALLNLWYNQLKQKTLENQKLIQLSIDLLMITFLDYLTLERILQTETHL